MIEDVLNGIRDKLIDGMQVEIAAINAEFNDNIRLTNITSKDIFTYEKASFQNYPNIIIIGTKTPVNYYMSAKDLMHFIILSCSIVDSNEEDLTKRMYRYLIVVRRIIENNDFLKEFSTTEGKLIELLIDEYRYSPMFTEEDSDNYKKDFYINMIAKERLLIGV